MEAANQDVVKSPEETEEGISSTPTVAWDPFTVFPKEIYLEIFDKLDNPDDKKNFMNAHVKWYALLKSKRTLFLFQDVFKEVSKIEEKFRVTCPYSCDLRLVCHEWDKGVQNNFQFNVSDFWLDYSGLNVGQFWTRSRCFHWDHGENLENDMKRFSVTHPPSKNPFLSRNLCINPSILRNYDDEERERRRAAVDSLLEKYGRHIWHCSMQTASTPQTCRQIAKWLSLMPELKTLQLYGTLFQDLLNQKELEEIRDMELLQPELNKLVVLKSDYVPSVAFNKLFGNLKEVERIQICLPRRNVSHLQDFVVLTKPETLKDAFFTPKCLQDMEYLGRSESFRNLKRLAIKFELDENAASLRWLEWRMLFNILEKFTALEEFSFVPPKAILDMDIETAKIQSLESTLNLPKLKKLWISLQKFASIDFLSPCKALEEFTLSWDFGDFSREDWAEVRRQEKIELNVDLSTLWESNVWDEFPKLRILQVGDWGLAQNDEFDCHLYEKAGEKRIYSLF